MFWRPAALFVVPLALVSGDAPEAWPSCVIKDAALRAGKPVYADVRPFMTSIEAYRHRRVLFGSTGVIGMVLQEDPHDLGELVENIVPNSQAANAGVRKGWIITEIDGKPFSKNQRLKDVVKDFDDAKHSSFTLTVDFDVRTFIDCAEGDCSRSDRFPASSPDVCADACQAVSACEWWYLGKLDEDPMCWMQSWQGSSLMSWKGAQTGKRECSPQAGGGAREIVAAATSGWPGCMLLNSQVFDEEVQPAVSATLVEAGHDCWSPNGNRKTLEGAHDVNTCSTMVSADVDCGTAFEFDNANKWCGCGMAGTPNAQCQEVPTSSFRESSSIYSVQQVTSALLLSGHDCYSPSNNRKRLYASSLDGCAAETAADKDCGTAFEFDASTSWCGCGLANTLNSNCQEVDSSGTGRAASSIYTVQRVSSGARVPKTPPVLMDVRPFIRHPDHIRHRTMSFHSSGSIGMILRDKPSPRGEVVGDVVPNSQAWAAGVRKGWIIVTVDDQLFKASENVFDVGRDFEKAKSFAPIVVVKFDVKSMVDCPEGDCSRSDRLPAESVEACAEACTQLPLCKWWTFNVEAEADSTCYVRTSIGNGLRPVVGATSGPQSCHAEGGGLFYYFVIVMFLCAAGYRYRRELGEIAQQMSFPQVSMPTMPTSLGSRQFVPSTPQLGAFSSPAPSGFNTGTELKKVEGVQAYGAISQNNFGF